MFMYFLFFVSFIWSFCSFNDETTGTGQFLLIAIDRLLMQLDSVCIWDFSAGVSGRFFDEVILKIE